jgi:Na+/proline symporter
MLSLRVCGMRNNRLMRFWIIAGFAFLMLIILLRGTLAVIPLAIVVAVIYGFFPCLLGTLAGFLIRKYSAPAGALAAAAFLVLWLAASPPLYISYGSHPLNRVNIWNDYTNVLAFIVSIVMYAACGAIGGELGGKLRSKLTNR